LEKTHRKHPNCIAELSVVTAQEIPPQGNLLVQVVGAFEDQKAQTKHRFSHTFVLLKEVDDAHEISFYIQNEVLVYLSGKASNNGGRRAQKPQKAEAAAPAPVAANGAVAPATVTPAPAEAAPAKAAETTKPAAATPAAAAAPKEKKQQHQKPKPAGKGKEEKPAEPAKPAAPKPTTWASIAKTDAPVGSSSSSTPAPVPAAVKSKPAAAPAAAKPASEAAKPAAPAPAKSEKLALFVGNLTPAVDEQALRKAFGAFGKVSKVDVIPRKNIGFVEFDAPVSAFAELSKKFTANPVVLDGKTLRIDQREASSSRPAKPTAGGKPQQRPKDKAPAEDFDQEEVPSGSLLAE
jgi:hypothetical protein